MALFWEKYLSKVRGIGEEKIGKSVTVSAYAKYTFGVSVNNGKEKFGK